MRKLYYNGHIHPMTDEAAEFSAIGVCGDRIDYIGNDIPSNYEKLIDLKGRHVYPALCDSHLHLLYSIVLSAGSFQVCEISPAGVEPKNLAGVSEKLGRYCAENPTQKIITDPTVERCPMARSVIMGATSCARTVMLP